MNRKILIGVGAGIVTAALTLAAVIAIVRGTILLLEITNVPLRILAVAAELIFASLLLIGCIYVATQRGVAIFRIANPVPPSPPQGPANGTHDS